MLKIVNSCALGPNFAGINCVSRTFQSQPALFTIHQLLSFVDGDKKVCGVESILLSTSTGNWQLAGVQTQQLLTATSVLQFFPLFTNIVSHKYCCPEVCLGEVGKQFVIRHWPKLTLTINDFVDKTELWSPFPNPIVPCSEK